MSDWIYKNIIFIEGLICIYVGVSFFLATNILFGMVLVGVGLILLVVDISISNKNKELKENVEKRGEIENG